MTSPALPNNGTPQADALTDLIRQEMQKILTTPQPGQAAVDPNALPPVPASTTLKVPVGGQVYEFADEKQLGEAIQKVVQESQAAIQAAQAQAQTPQPAQTPAAPPKGPDLETFVERLKQDPAEGINYALREKYGVGIEDLVQAAQMMTQTQEAMVAGRFKDLHPEFIPNQQNASIINQTRAYLNLPYTVDGLEAAYLVAANRGALQLQPRQDAVPGQAPTQPAQSPYAQPQVNQPPASIQQYGLGGFGGGRALPPPSLGGRGGAEPPPDLVSMAEQMTAPQLEEFLRKQSHLFAPGQ